MMNKPGLIAFISTLVVIPLIAYATQVKVNIPTGITGPGSVPIGGMVAIMPTTHANAWQPPASGAIKDGFMRADGSTVPTCADCTIPAGTVLPNMVGNFAKGTATTSGTAATAQKLVLANIPRISTPYTPVGTNAASGVSGTVGGTDGTHTHTATTSAVLESLRGMFYPHTDNRHTAIISVAPSTVTVNSTNSGHSHAFSLTAAAQVFTGTEATITVGTEIGSQTVVPDPANVTVIWVIRVK